MLEGPADPSGVTDPTGQGQCVGEPLLGVADPTSGVLQQAELAQRRGDQPVAAGALGFLQGGDQRGRCLIVPPLFVTEIAEDAVRGGPKFGCGHSQGRP